VYFVTLTFLVPVLFTFYIIEMSNSGAKRLIMSICSQEMSVTVRLFCEECYTHDDNSCRIKWYNCLKRTGVVF
jgi:hypothetical protein